MSLDVRKSVDELTEAERINYANAFSKLLDISKQLQSDNRGFYYVAGFHGWPDNWCWHHLVRRRKGATSRPLRLFFPWHRAYLMDLEQRLQDFIDTVRIPWWDWTSNISRRNGIPKLFTDKFIGGKPNPFVSIDLPNNIPRDPGAPRPLKTWRSPGPKSALPKKASIDFALGKNDFEDAELFIENLHDQIHGWVGGTMGAVATAAYDMIFYSHHCMIDRIWYLWQKKHGNASGLEDLLDEPLPPFRRTVKGVLDIHQLGYDYAVNSATIEL